MRFHKHNTPREGGALATGALLLAHPFLQDPAMRLLADAPDAPSLN